MNDKIYETTHQMGEYPKVVIYAILSAFPILGITLIVCSVFVSYSAIVIERAPIIAVFLLFAVMVAIGILLVVIGWQFINAGMAKYRFNNNGVYAKFPLQQEKLFPWDTFQQVCVCYSAYTTRGKQQKACTVICCVKHGETKNAHGRWKTDNPFRYHTLFVVDYSPELYNGIKEMCPYEVIDLRETYAYRLR